MGAPYYQDDTVRLFHGDCLDVLAELPDASVDVVVTDPPYGLEFMGKEWDSFKQTEAAWATRDKSEDLTGKTSSPFLAARVNRYGAGKPFQDWCQQWAAECLRVLKPGGHMLAFGGTRT
jgi:DNA modification methylase